jgi:hypothetical protein
MRKKTNAVEASTIAKVVALSLFIGGSGVGYVFQKSQIVGLGDQVAGNLETIHELEERHKNVRLKFERATSREQLELMARRFQLPLGEPDRKWIIELPEPRVEPGRTPSLARQE